MKDKDKARRLQKIVSGWIASDNIEFYFRKPNPNRGDSTTPIVLWHYIGMEIKSGDGMFYGGYPGDLLWLMERVSGK